MCREGEWVSRLLGPKGGLWISSNLHPSLEEPLRKRLALVPVYWQTDPGTFLAILSSHSPLNMKELLALRKFLGEENGAKNPRWQGQG